MRVDGGSYCSRRLVEAATAADNLFVLGHTGRRTCDVVPVPGNREWCNLPGGNRDPPLEAGSVAEGGVAESSGVGGAKLFEAGARRDGDDEVEDGAEQGWKSRGGEAGCGRRLAAMTRPVIARVIATNL